MAPGVIGRDMELAALEKFLDSVAAGPSLAAGRRALVLRGEPGMGKTTLWEAGVEAARERGHRVLSSRPSEADGSLSHAALSDLLETVETEVLTTLPAPQRHALDVALLQVEPSGPPPEPRAIAAGVLGVLRGLAAGAPVVVAVDDVQWLDAPSADALTFAARRLHGHAVGFLLTERSGSASSLSLAFEPGGLERIAIGPLSLGATRHLLAQRLGLSLPRPALRRIVESTRGNPLFALEVGRMAVDRDLRNAEDLPVPERIEDLLGIRVAALAGPIRTALVAVAMSADLRPSQLATIVEPSVIDEAVRAGLLLVEGDRVRASHPLLAAAASQQARAAEIRELHRALARAMIDERRWARHLALAATSPDATLASTVAAVASSAAARGAADGAVELAEHALR